LKTQSVVQVADHLRIPRSTFRREHLGQLRLIFSIHGLGNY